MAEKIFKITPSKLQKAYRLGIKSYSKTLKNKHCFSNQSAKPFLALICQYETSLKSIICNANKLFSA